MDNDCPLGIEFPVDGDLFGKPGKLRACLARAKKRRHNEQWTGPDNSTTTTQFKKNQEQQDMTETRLKEPKSNRMDMSHMTIRLETVTAESKQQAWELETMRKKYEAWRKRAEDLTYENELLKREIWKVKEEQDSLNGTVETLLHQLRLQCMPRGVYLQTS